MCKAKEKNVKNTGREVAESSALPKYDKVGFPLLPGLPAKLWGFYGMGWEFQGSCKINPGSRAVFLKNQA